MYRVLIIELFDFHEEVFPLYYALLPSLLSVPASEIDYQYIVTPRYYHELENLPQNRLHLVENKLVRYLVRKTKKGKTYYPDKINKVIAELKPDLVIMNSIESPALVEVFNQIKAPVKLAMIHNAFDSVYDDLQLQDNMLLFCLNRFNFDYIGDKFPLHGYFTAAFADYEFDEYRATENIEIAVPGWVHFRRRDYRQVIELAQLLQQQNIHHVRFNIIGEIGLKHGPKLLKQIKQHGIQDYFITHQQRPGHREFRCQLAKADFVFPLLSANSKYTSGSASANVGHAFAYSKPLILLNEVAAYMGLSDAECICYQSTSEIIEKIMDKQHYSKLVVQFKQYLETLITDNRLHLEKLAVNYHRLLH